VTVTTTLKPASDQAIDQLAEGKPYAYHLLSYEPSPRTRSPRTRRPSHAVTQVHLAAELAPRGMPRAG